MEEIKTNQDFVAQSAQINQPDIPITPRNNNIYKYLFFIAIVILLGVIVGFYYVLNNKIDKLSNKQITDITSIPTQKINIDSEITPTNVPTIASTKSTLVQKDANNNLYTNNKFGFSLVIPKSAISAIECRKESDSYRPNIGSVPIAFFENDDIVYLAADNFYRLTGEQKTSDGRSNFSGCEKLKTTFKLIETDRVSSDRFASLKIYATNIKNDDELESYFKSKYGLGCRLGEKNLSDIPNVYNVKILSDGKDLVESQCPINFAITTEYNPIKGKLVIFELGQACNLYQDNHIGGGFCYDTDIVKSLKFL
jgi:hypothetical protein